MQGPMKKRQTAVGREKTKTGSGTSQELILQNKAANIKTENQKLRQL